MIEPKENTRVLRELSPRRLSWFTQAVLLCGDQVSQAGWFLLAIGSVFFWTTTINSDVKFFLKSHITDWEQKAGVVLEADSTRIKEQGQRVWRYLHSFALGGYRYKGTSYSAGKKFDVGQIIFIQYDPRDPRVNCIVGLERSAHRWQVNLLLLFPLAGLIIIAGASQQSLRTLRLLKTGNFTQGKMVEKLATGRVAKRGVETSPVFKYLFRFEQAGVLYLASCYTHEVSQVEDEATESILFDPRNPAINLVYDAIPNMPLINSKGKMEPLPYAKSGVLFLPAFVIAVNLVFVVGLGIS